MITCCRFRSGARANRGLRRLRDGAARSRGWQGVRDISSRRTRGSHSRRGRRSNAAWASRYRSWSGATPERLRPEGAGRRAIAAPGGRNRPGIAGAPVDKDVHALIGEVDLATTPASAGAARLSARARSGRSQGASLHQRGSESVIGGSLKRRFSRILRPVLPRPPEQVLNAVTSDSEPECCGSTAPRAFVLQLPPSFVIGSGARRGKRGRDMQRLALCLALLLICGAVSASRSSLQAKPRSRRRPLPARQEGGEEAGRAEGTAGQDAVRRCSGPARSPPAPSAPTPRAACRRRLASDQRAGLAGDAALAQPQLGTSAPARLSRAAGKRRAGARRLARPPRRRHVAAARRADDDRPHQPSDRTRRRHLAHARCRTARSPRKSARTSAPFRC